MGNPSSVDPNAGQLVSTEQSTQGVVATQDFNALSQLDSDQRVEARGIASKFDPSDSVGISRFAIEAQQHTSDTVRPMLELAQNQQAGTAGEELIKLMNSGKELDPDFLKQATGFFKSFRSKAEVVKAYIQKFQTIDSQIQQVVHEVEGKIRVLEQGVHRGDVLFQDNAKAYRNLLVYIGAGEQIVNQLQKKLDQKRTDYANSSDPFQVTELADLEQVITRVRRRVHSLKKSAISCAQAGTEIRLLQKSAIDVIDALNDGLVTAIPILLRTFAMALGVEDQRSALRVVQALSDGTNSAMVAKAKLIGETARIAATTANAGTLNVDALEETYKLISTAIHDVRAIDAQAVQKMDAESKKIGNLAHSMVEDLKAARSLADTTSSNAS